MEDRDILGGLIKKDEKMIVHIHPYLTILIVDMEVTLNA